MLHRENKIKEYHTSSASDLLEEVMQFYEITQTDLAARIGVSQKNVSDILHRKRFINEVLALRIETVTGISSKLLLALDTNYKLNLAKQKENTVDQKMKSPLFLQRYKWVNA